MDVSEPLKFADHLPATQDAPFPDAATDSPPPLSTDILPV